MWSRSLWLALQSVSIPKPRCTCYCSTQSATSIPTNHLVTLLVWIWDHASSGDLVSNSGDKRKQPSGGVSNAAADDYVQVCGHTHIYVHSCACTYVCVHMCVSACVLCIHVHMYCPEYGSGHVVRYTPLQLQNSSRRNGLCAHCASSEFTFSYVFFISSSFVIYSTFCLLVFVLNFNVFGGGVEYRFFFFFNFKSFLFPFLPPSFCSSSFLPAFPYLSISLL